MSDTRLGSAILDMNHQIWISDLTRDTPN
jgi:hypothetical protein